MSRCRPLTVVVPYVAPSVQIVGVPANEYVAEGYAFSLASVVNNPTPGDNLTESWTVTAGDGSESPYTESGPSVTYTPDDIGTYTVTLDLLDASNQVVASVSQQIISIGVAPTATISGGPQGGTTTEGTSVSFSGAASSPSTVTTAKGFYYSWSVMLGAYTYVAPTTPTINDTSFSFTPGQAGTYVVSLSVTDYHGFTSVAATETVAVAAVASFGDDHGPARRQRHRGNDRRSRQHRHQPQCRAPERRVLGGMDRPVRRGDVRAVLRPGAEPHAGLRRQLYRGADGHGCRGRLVHGDAGDHRRRYRSGPHAIDLADGTAAPAGDDHRVQSRQRDRPRPRQ